MNFNGNFKSRTAAGKAAVLAATSLLTVIGADCFIPVATAEDQSVPAGAAASDEGEGGGLQEITVTARRRSENLQSEPLSIQALTGVQMAQMNIQNLGDVTTIANVNFNVQPGYINTIVPFIRGIGEQDPILTGDSPVAMYVNGVLYARALGLNFDMIDPQSIEVLRGPQGSLFGRNTTGGAVNITLPGPTDDFEVTAKAGYATNNEQTYKAIINTGLLGDSGLKALVAIERHTMDGYVQNGLTTDPNAWPGSDQTTAEYFDLHGNFGSVGSFDFRADYSYSLDDILSGQLSYMSPAEFNYFSASPSYGGDPIQVSLSRLNSIDLQQGPLSTGSFGGTSFTAEFPLSDALNIKSISAFRKFTTNVDPASSGTGLLYGPVVNPVTYAPAGIQRVTPYLLEDGLLGSPNSDLSRQYQISQELQFSGDVTRNKYVAGLFAFQEQVSESYLAILDIPLPPTGTYALPDNGGLSYAGRSQSYAIFASDSFTPPILNDKLELTGGVRYTVDRKWLDYLAMPQLPTLPTANHYASFSDPSGDFTAKYQWTPDQMTYVRFSNSYLSGGFSGRDVANAPGYKPETANNWEIGGKSDWLDKRVRFNADLYYTIYDNKQVTTYGSGLGANGINESTIVNAGKAVYPGGEAELTLAPAKGWEVNVNYGRSNPKYKEFLYQPLTGGPVYNIASQAKFPYFSNTSYSIGGTYTAPQLPIGELSVRTDFSYKSGMYFFPTDIFNPLNETIKAGSQNILNASINLAHLPFEGKTDLTISVYGKNLLNKAYVTQAVDYEIIGGYDSFSTSMFARPRVIGVLLAGKF